MDGVCDKWCSNCYYHKWIYANVYYCNYFFVNGKPRPCTAGTGCTERLKVKYKRHRKKKKPDGGI